jgi:hypothetical protein
MNLLGSSQMIWHDVFLALMEERDEQVVEIPDDVQSSHTGGGPAAFGAVSASGIVMPATGIGFRRRGRSG